MGNVVSVDQSFSTTAVTYWQDGTMVGYGLIGCPKVKENCEFYSGLWLLNVKGSYQEIYRSSKLYPAKHYNIFEKALFIASEFDTMNDMVSGTQSNYDYYSDFIFEQLAFGGMGNATRDLAALLATMINCNEYITNAKLLLVAPTAAKKVFTGNGKAKKDEMVAALPVEILEEFKSKNISKTRTKKNWKGLEDLADSYSFYKWYQEKK